MADIYEQVIAVSDPRETQADVLDYYQRAYGGGWKSKLARDLSPIAGVKPDSIMRRFQKGRSGSAKSRAQSQAEYQELGEQLPPKAPESGYHIHGTIWVQFSGDCEEREIDETITGADADELVILASKGLGEKAIINQYMGDDIDSVEGFGPCGSWDSLIVEAL